MIALIVIIRSPLALRAEHSGGEAAPPLEPKGGCSFRRAAGALS